MHSYKKCVFPHVRNFTLTYGLYSCLIDVIFGPILMENCVFFLSNSSSILKLMLCNTNITKLDILTFRLQKMSSKIEQAFEKNKQTMFLSSFCQFHLKSIFFSIFSIPFSLNILYFTSSLNLCDKY